MKIVRKLDLLCAILPVVVKVGQKTVARVTSFESVKDIKIGTNTDIQLRLEFFSKKLTVSENSILVIEQPKSVRVLSLFVIVSLMVMKLTWGRNEILDYSLCIAPIFYLLAIAYFWLFRRTHFLQTTLMN
jgi:hypothetical protein